MSWLLDLLDPILVRIGQAIADRTAPPTPASRPRPRIRLWDSHWNLIADSDRGDTISP